ncbi:MAG: hypothetical protein QNJ90_16720 [Planctomycetota bacterium]|nr:hypothetical protein [Planctomycetota bacterium]
MPYRLRFLCLCLAGVLALLGCGDAGGADSLEDLARVSVEALRTGDFSICEPYLFTAADMEWLVTSMEDGTSRSATKVRKKHSEVGSEKMLTEIRGQVRKSFDALRKELIEEKIDPSKLQFDRIHKPRQKTVDGIEVGGCYIRLLIDGKPGEIRLETCFKSPRGWLFGEGWKS